MQILTVLIISMSLVSILSLTTSGFNAIYSVIIGIFVLIFFAVFVKSPKDLTEKSVLTLIVILFGIILRLPVHQYVMGGQDQGTYLNIGHQYFEQHSLNYKDSFRTSLNTDQKLLYDKHINYLMPSIELTYPEKSTFEMKFYPLHSIWLAIFEGILGKNNAIYSLTMFSILSIIFFSLLAYEISGKSKLAGFITAMLFSINPMHAFFSKFPVGEMTAVAFTSLGFYFFVKYIKKIKTGENKTIFLVLSLLSFSCFFYTRMSSMLYLPIFFFFAILTVLYASDSKAKRNLLIYFAFIAVSFCISYLFYYLYQPSLFYLIYKATIQDLIPHNSDLITWLALLLFGFIVLALYRIHNQKILSQIRLTLENYLPLLSLITIGSVLYITFITFLNIHLHDLTPLNTFERYWYIGTTWCQKLKYLNLYVIMEYLTPVGFVLCFVAGFHYLRNFQKNIFKTSLFVFIVWFLFVNIKFLGLMRYPYYNTRYLFSESVAYMLLLIGIFLGEMIQNKKTKIMGIISLILIISCSLPFTLFQLNGIEGPHMDFYNNITSIVKKEDLLLTSTRHSSEKLQKYFDNFTTWSIAPLKFYYDLNVFILPSLDDTYTRPIKELSSRFKSTYLISDIEHPELGKNLITIRHRYSYYNVSEECSLHTYSFLPLESVVTMKIPKFLECLTPPNNYYTRYSNLYLYNITSSLKK